MFSYILQVAGCSVLLYGYYHLILRNERFHQYNRFYLLALVPLSFLLPLLRFTLPLQNEMVLDVANKLNQLSVTLPEVIIISRRPTPLTRYGVPVLYGLITLIFLIRIAIALIKVIRLKQQHTAKRAAGWLLIGCGHPDVPFSFFNWIFWNPGTNPDTVPRIKRERETFAKVGVPAKFDGDWQRFLFTNLKPEVGTDNGAPAGSYKAVIQFIVDVDGTISDVKILKDPGYGMATEAERIVKLSGKWIPAIQNKRKVRSFVQQPVTYSIQEN